MNTALTTDRRYLIKWAGRCKYDAHDKIWGWFFYLQQGYDNANVSQPIFYTFWARTGKTPSFKRHSYDRWTAKRLVSKKQERHYQDISVKELEQIWPTFWSDIENRFIFYLMSEKV